MKTHLLLVVLVLSFYACTTCGPDEQLGTIQLTEKTLDFLPYRGNDILIFEDQDGILHELRPKEERFLVTLGLVTEKLCEDSFFGDEQEAFYEIENTGISFVDTEGELVFTAKLSTSYEREDSTDAIALFDYFSIIVYHPSVGGGELSVILEEQLNELSETERAKSNVNKNEFIGDTTLYGRDYEEVYKGRGHNNFELFYNKNHGLIAFGTEDKYWVLKE